MRLFEIYLMDWILIITSSTHTFLSGYFDSINIEAAVDVVYVFPVTKKTLVFVRSFNEHFIRVTLSLRFIQWIPKLGSKSTKFGPQELLVMITVPFELRLWFEELRNAVTEERKAFVKL